MNNLEIIQAEIEKIREAKSALKRSPPWFVDVCNVGESCWCRTIGNKPNDDSLEHCVAPSGTLTKDEAEFVVLAANRIDSLLNVIEMQAKELDKIRSTDACVNCLDIGYIKKGIPSANSIADQALTQSAKMMRGDEG